MIHSDSDICVYEYMFVCVGTFVTGVKIRSLNLHHLLDFPSVLNAEWYSSGHHKSNKSFLIFKNFDD